MLKWIVAAVAIGAASPDVPNRQLASTGVGTSPCSLFTQINARDPGWARNNYLSWAQGFMTGENDERIAQKHPSAIVNSKTDDELWADLQNYCNAHPNEPFLKGLMILYLSLPTKSLGQRKSNCNSAQNWVVYSLICGYENERGSSSPVTMDRVSDRIAVVAVGIHDVRALCHVVLAPITVKATHNDRPFLLSVRGNVNRSGRIFVEAVCAGLYEFAMQQNCVAIRGNEMELRYDRLRGHVEDRGTQAGAYRH